MNDIDKIAMQAQSDQQAGISVMRGRTSYTAVADRAHYTNMWLESFRVNGMPAAFAR